MTRIPSLLAVWLVLAVALMACSGDQASTPTATATPTETPSPTPTETPEPTPSPTSPTETASESAEASGDQGALADALPDEIGGLARQPIPLDIEAAMAPMLEQQGLDADEADFAYAVWGEGQLTVIAMRLPGIDEAQMELIAQAISSSQAAGGAQVEAEPASVAGREVLRMTGAGVPDAAYIYIAGDAFFTVVSDSADLAEELLSELP